MNKDEILIKMPFSAKFEYYKKMNKYKISDIAKKSGLNSSLISKLITDNINIKRKLRWDYCVKLALAFNIKPQELIDGTEYEELKNDYVKTCELEKEILRKEKIIVDNKKNNIKYTLLKQSISEIIVEFNELILKLYNLLQEE